MPPLQMTTQESRAIGAMVGGAIGDAMGMSQEIFVTTERSLEEILDTVRRQRTARITKGIQTDYEAGGPWTGMGVTLQRGEWTDDTTMSLCLADSILQMKTVGVPDLMTKFCDWWFNALNACGERAVGLGGNIAKALYAFDPRHPHRILGGTDPSKDAGNGSIMRLAPVPIYWHDDPEEAQRMARLQTATTHNVPEALDASALMTHTVRDILLWDTSTST